MFSETYDSFRNFIVFKTFVNTGRGRWGRGGYGRRRKKSFPLSHPLTERCPIYGLFNRNARGKMVLVLCSDGHHRRLGIFTPKTPWYDNIINILHTYDGRWRTFVRQTLTVRQQCFLRSVTHSVKQPDLHIIIVIGRKREWSFLCVFIFFFWKK